MIGEDWLSDTPGVVTAISVAVQAFTRPGDKVLIQSPVYPRFFSCVAQNRRELVVNPLRLDSDGYSIDFNHLEQALASGVKISCCAVPTIRWAGHGREAETAV